MKATQRKLAKSQLEIEFELTAEEFEHHFEHAIEHLKGHVKVDGFRPGQAPNKLVEDKIKPEALLMEAGDHAVQHVYSEYISENKLEPVGQPEVKILKIVPTAELSRIRDSVKNGVGTKDIVFSFTATITVLPDVELPDYKEIAKKVREKDISVTEEEVQDSLNYLQKTRAKFTAKNEPADKKDFVEITYQNKDINEGKEVQDQFVLGEGGFMKGFEDNIVGMKAGEEKEFKVPIPKGSRILDADSIEHSRLRFHRESSTESGQSRNKIGTKFQEGMEMDFKVKVKSVQKMELPEINDEFAKQLGAFDTLVALRENLKEGITIEKTEAEKQRVRSEILEKITERARFSPSGGSPEGGEIPQAIIEYEKQRLLEDLKNKITQNLKITFEEYLATVKQTEEQLKETYQKEAEKRLKGFLVLRELGKKENIEVSDKEVEEEIEKSLGRSPTGEAIKNFSKESRLQGNRGSSTESGQLQKIDINQLKEYTKGVINNEKIFNLLENFSK